ncbi:uncharacterized protein [Ranitomeya imitator]|uniref:uncharacterized protein n=1 Tax=Ranitomeya imitator TaxID=111125 RepID=UPI0037E71A97
MDSNRDKMMERILHLTLEILFRLTGEDYTVVKKTSNVLCQTPVTEGWGRPLSPIMGPPPHPLIHEDINYQNILELAYKMIELLTGEVPIRCQDVTVYFSMEEWEYLEGHKNQYKDIMMEMSQPLTSPGNRQDKMYKAYNYLYANNEFSPCMCFLQFYPGKYLSHINSTETFVRGDERCKKEITADNCTALLYCNNIAKLYACKMETEAERNMQMCQASDKEIGLFSSLQPVTPPDEGNVPKHVLGSGTSPAGGDDHRY